MATENDISMVSVNGEVNLIHLGFAYTYSNPQSNGNMIWTCVNDQCSGSILTKKLKRPGDSNKPYKFVAIRTKHDDIIRCHRSTGRTNELPANDTIYEDAKNSTQLDLSSSSNSSLNDTIQIANKSHVTDGIHEMCVDIKTEIKVIIEQFKTKGLDVSRMDTLIGELFNILNNKCINEDLLNQIEIQKDEENELEELPPLGPIQIDTESISIQPEEPDFSTLLKTITEKYYGLVNSILGVTLFLIYINDIPDYMTDENTVLFADDSTFTKTTSELNQCEPIFAQMLDRVTKWFSANELYINSSKTEKVIFSLKNTDNYENPESVTLLGTKLQPNLCWDSHIDHIATKLNKNTYLLRNLSFCVSQETLRVVYFGLIQSHLTYAILAWGHSAVQERAFRLQRKAIRIVGKIPFRAPCNDTYRSLGILTFPCLFILHCLLYAKTHMTQYIRQNEVHSYNTRHNHQFRQPYLRLMKSQNSTKYWCYKLINKIPANIIELSYVQFKTKIKDFLVSKAYFSITDFLNDNISGIT
uniref:Reverse transcriptase domain-containing protein n=1 Tax=Cacopsylla melanoneura TaxID=428564 RepID=A0A8D8TV71_9HEMI